MVISDSNNWVELAHGCWSLTCNITWLEPGSIFSVQVNSDRYILLHIRAVSSLAAVYLHTLWIRGKIGLGSEWFPDINIIPLQIAAIEKKERDKRKSKKRRKSKQRSSSLSKMDKLETDKLEIEKLETEKLEANEIETDKFGKSPEKTDEKACSWRGTNC